MVCYAEAPGSIIKWTTRSPEAQLRPRPRSPHLLWDSPTLRSDEPRGRACYHHGLWRIYDLGAQQAQISCRTRTEPPLWQLWCLLSSGLPSPLPGLVGRRKASAAPAPLPGVAGGCEGWGRARGCRAGGRGVPPGRAALGSKDCSEACRNLSPFPEVVFNVAQARSQTPKSLNANFQSRNGLRWGW